MNIPSYSNQDTSKSANNKNKIVIIAGGQLTDSDADWVAGNVQLD